MAQAIFIGRDGQQLGPYSRDQIGAMAAAGQILPGDMAWHEGMAAWETASAVLARLGIAAAAGVPPPPLPPAAVRIPPRNGAAGGAAAPDRNLVAGLGMRWLASLIDGLLLGCVGAVVCVVWGIGAAGDGHGGFGGTLLLVLLLMQLAYFTLLQGGSGMASLGKRALGLMVVGSDGQPIGYGRAALRYFILMITSYLLPLLLVALFTRRRQGLHDFAAGSVVIERASYDPQHWDYDGLHRSGRGGALLVLAIGLMVGVFVIGMLAAIAIPAYQDYTMRARVAAAIAQADAIKAGVTRHYTTSNEPVQYADLGMSGPMSLPGGGGLITVNTSGVITITMGLPPLTGQSLRLTPNLSATGIGWACASDDIRKKYLPQNCR